MRFNAELWPRLSPLLDEWLELEPASRQEWLKSLGPEYSDVLPLLRDVLDEAAAADGFLERLPIFIKTTPLAEESGNASPFAANAEIGPYRLIRELGAGGMSVVWLAERADGAVNRPVALKLPLARADRSFAERLARERDILAQLNHPHIARLYDAGISAEGHPYLALEYIQGETITAYCDRQCLGVAARLRLFLDVLRAVQYAHSNLVVHRDLKPSNIMVTSGGEVRLLDFGIAKLLVEGEAQETELTRMGGRALTPEYASPEQITSSPITTASDVYSLGVLLYELLTGERPYRLKRDTLGSLEEAIVSAEVIRPSQAARNEAKAQARGSNTRRLGKTLKGDLDTIALKALQKQPQQRYATADAFSQDIERYLGGEPVLAQGESTWYRARKFVRRNKLAVASAAAIAAALGIGIGAALWQAHIALNEKRRADTESAVAQAVNEFLRNDLLAQASPQTQAGGKGHPDANLTVRAALDRAAARIPGRFDKQPLVEAAVRQTIGDTYKDLGLFHEAQQQMEHALAMRRHVLGDANKDTLESMNNLALLYTREAKYAQAEPLSVQVVEIRRRLLGGQHPDTLTSIDNLSELYWHLGKYAKAEAMCVQLLETRRRVLGEQHADTLSSMNNLALNYVYEGKYAQAEPLFIKIVEVRRRVLGPEHPNTLLSMNNLPLLYVRQGKYEKAIPLFVEAMELGRRVLGPEHPETLTTMNNLAFVYRHEGRYDDAEPLFRHVLDVRLRVLGEQHPSTLTSMNGLATLLQAQGKYASAENLFNRILDIQRRTLGEEHPNSLSVADNLAVLYREELQFKRAEPLFVKVLETKKRVLGENHPDTLATKSRIADLYRAEGKYGEAETLFANVVDGRRRALGPEHPDTGDAMTSLGGVMLLERKYAAAEPLLREALRIQERAEPDSWMRYRTESMLGASLAGRGRYSDAEPLLVSGHRGLKERQSTIPFDSRPILKESAGWLGRVQTAGRP